MVCMIGGGHGIANLQATQDPAKTGAKGGDKNKVRRLRWTAMQTACAQLYLLFFKFTHFLSAALVKFC